MRARVHVFLGGGDKMRLRGFVEGIEVMRECFVDELRGKDKRDFIILWSKYHKEKLG